MGAKSDYVNRLTAETPEYPGLVIDSLKQFKRGFKFNAPVPEPDRTEQRVAGMKGLLAVLCSAYSIQPVNLRVYNTNGGSSESSNYISETRTITMVGRLSIITLLHEFAHAINLSGGEEFARKWSLCLFKTVYPRAFERLDMANESPECFVLRMPEQS